MCPVYVISGRDDSQVAISPGVYCFNPSSTTSPHQPFVLPVDVSIGFTLRLAVLSDFHGTFRVVKVSRASSGRPITVACEQSTHSSSNGKFRNWVCAKFSMVVGQPVARLCGHAVMARLWLLGDSRITPQSFLRAVVSAPQRAPPAPTPGASPFHLEGFGISQQSRFHFPSITQGQTTVESTVLAKHTAELRLLTPESVELPLASPGHQCAIMATNGVEGYLTKADPSAGVQGGLRLCSCSPKRLAALPLREAGDCFDAQVLL